MKNVNRQKHREHYVTPVIELVNVKLIENYFGSGGSVQDLPYNDGHWY